MRLNNFLLFTILFISVQFINAQTTKWRVVWEANPDSENVIYYAIYKGTTAIFSSMDSVGRVNHPDTVFIDSVGSNSLGLDPGQMYYYRIIAVNDTGVSSLPSNDASAAIPKIMLDDTLLFSKNAVDTIPKVNVVLDPDHDIYPDSLTWTIDDIITMHYQSSGLTFDILQDYRAGYSTNQNWQGPLQVHFKVTDPDNFYDSTSVIFLLYTPVNTSPIVSGIENQTIEQPDTTFDTFDLDNYVTDDGDIADLVWNFSGNTILDVQIDVNNVVNVTVPSSSWIGSEVIRFTATDTGGLSGYQDVSFSVLEQGNHKPWFTSFDYDSTIQIETEYKYLVSAHDPDGDSLTFQLINNSPSFLEVDNLTDTTANIIGVADSSEVGQYTITILVTDGRGGDTTQVYNLVVTLPPPIEGGNEIYKRYPNPYIESESPSKRIHFENYPVGSILLIYNLTGELVANPTIDNNLFLWDVKNKAGLNVQSGLYFYYVKYGNDIIKSGKIVIVR